MSKVPRSGPGRRRKRLASAPLSLCSRPIRPAVAGGRWLPAMVALTIVAALGIWLRRGNQRGARLTFGLVIGEALGNVADRLRLGASLT